MTVRSVGASPSTALLSSSRTSVRSESAAAQTDDVGGFIELELDVGAALIALISRAAPDGLHRVSGLLATPGAGHQDRVFDKDSGQRHEGDQLKLHAVAFPLKKARSPTGRGSTAMPAVAKLHGEADWDRRRDC